MKATVTQKVSIGIFTLTGLFLLAAGIFIIGEQRNMFDRTFSVRANFRNIGGLKIGNNVRFGGIDIGTVTTIDITNDTTVRIGMRLKEKVHQFVKSDAMATIGSDGLMGDKLINISPGSPEAPAIKDGGVIHAADPVDFDAIIKRIASVADNADAITASLADITGHISSGKGSIGRLIYSDTLERSLEKTVNAARQTVQSAKKGAEGLQENMEAMKHNFLLKGYFKKKAKRQQEQQQQQQQQTQPQKEIKTKSK